MHNAIKILQIWIIFHSVSLFPSRCEDTESNVNDFIRCNIKIYHRRMVSRGMGPAVSWFRNFPRLLFLHTSGSRRPLFPKHLTIEKKSYDLWPRILPLCNISKAKLLFLLKKRRISFSWDNFFFYFKSLTPSESELKEKWLRVKNIKCHYYDFFFRFQNLEGKKKKGPADDLSTLEKK